MKTDRIPVESFRPYWERYLRWGHLTFPRVNFGNSNMSRQPFNAVKFQEHLGITEAEYYYVLKAMADSCLVLTLPDELCDRIMTAMEEPHNYRMLVHATGGRRSHTVNVNGLRGYLAGIYDGPGGVTL